MLWGVPIGDRKANGFKVLCKIYFFKSRMSRVISLFIFSFLCLCVIACKAISRVQNLHSVCDKAGSPASCSRAGLTRGSRCKYKIQNKWNGNPSVCRETDNTVWKFVKTLFSDNPCEQKWHIWPFTSMGTMVFCWSCKQNWSWSNGNYFLRFLVLIRSWSSNRIFDRPINGWEISISVFGRTRCTRQYIFKDCDTIFILHKLHQCGTDDCGDDIFDPVFQLLHRAMQHPNPKPVYAEAFNRSKSMLIETDKTDKADRNRWNR